MRRTATLLLTTTAFCWGISPSLAAEGDPVTGYWTRTRAGLPVPVQPPDPVPEGGSWIAGDPSGPLSVGALRADLPEGLVAVELRWTVGDAVGPPAVQACPSDDRWVPEQGGRLEGAPAADCSAPLEATVDGDVLVVPLPPGLNAVNVLVQPAPGSSFSLTLERATAATVVTTTSQPSAPFAPAPFAPAPPPPFDTSGPAFESPALPPFAAGEPAAAPLVAAPQLPTPAAAPVAPAPQTAPAPMAVPANPRRAIPRDDRAQSLLALGVLALLGVQAARLARRPDVAPRALGGAARRSRPAPVDVAPPTAPRGVGRFRAARVRPPVRI